MSYRKITVDGTIHEYTIGKSYTKIKGIGVHPNFKVIGLPYDNDEKISITPQHIANLVRSHNEK